jgi:hypothetical protein
MAGDRPKPLVTWLDNQRLLDADAELTRQRHLAFERSQRAAAKALETLRAERNAPHAGMTDARTKGRST